MPARKHIGNENLIGQNVVLYRKQRGMNQQMLLAQLQLRQIDINQSALSALEGQQRKVSDRELLALAQIFSVSVDDLFHPPKE